MTKEFEKNPALEQLEPKYTGERYACFTARAQVRDDYIRQIAQPDSARRLLLEQLNCRRLSRKVSQAAKLIVDNLDSDGYFREDLDLLAGSAGMSLEVLREGLAEVQALDPAGVGARNLPECLELQLTRRAETDPMLFRLVERHLEALAAHRYAEIAKRLGTSKARVRQYETILSALNPHPCDLENQENYILPDVSILPNEQGILEVLFAEDAYPRLRVDPSFQELNRAGDEQLQSYVRDSLREATQLMEALEARSYLLHAFVELLVQRQRAYLLDQGPLLPLTNAEAAQALNVHPTTVYRLVRNRYILCIHGVEPLSKFLQREIDGFSVDEIANRIRRLCEENAHITDRELQEKLTEQGMHIARRTVSKYRRQLANEKREECSGESKSPIARQTDDIRED